MFGNDNFMDPTQFTGKNAKKIFLKKKEEEKKEK